MNFEVVKQIVEYARSKEKEYNKNFRFTITTNGMLLNDDKIDFINKEMSNVVLSIDGRKSVNDGVRKCINGDGCYDIIMPKFKTLVEKRNHDQYYVRGTFTKYNLDFADDVFHFYEEGFDQISVELQLLLIAKCLTQLPNVTFLKFLLSMIILQREFLKTMRTASTSTSFPLHA